MLLHNKLQKDYTLNQSGYQLKLPLENCKRDINFIFLLEGHSAPDHATLARFRSIHFAPCSKHILAEVSRLRQMPINILSCGKKPLQKSIEALEEALSKLKEYTQ